MPEAVVEDFNEDDLVPEDVLFRGALISVKDRQQSYDDKYTGQRVNQTKWVWTFKILDGQYQGRTVRGETFANFRVGNQPFEWVKALNGDQAPDVGANINTDHYLGTECTFEVSHRAYKNREGADKVAVEVARVYALVNAAAPPY